MKVIFIKKATLAVITLMVIFLSIFAINNSILDVGAAYFLNVKKLPIYSVETQENKLAISFDAAWGADKTTEIMNICDSYNIKATFFLVGFWAEKYPEKVKEIYNRGFEIGIHSNTHPDMTKLTRKEIKEELTVNINIIQNITGEKPNLFRPPYGYYNNNLIEACEELGLFCIEWSVDSLDWKGLSASEISGRVSSKVEKGSIVLFHNNSDNIIDGLKLVLEHFKLNKMQVEPIGNLIYKDNYTINNQGKQICL